MIVAGRVADTLAEGGHNVVSFSRSPFYYLITDLRQFWFPNMHSVPQTSNSPINES